MRFFKGMHKHHDDSHDDGDGAVPPPLDQRSISEGRGILPSIDDDDASAQQCSSSLKIAISNIFQPRSVRSEKSPTPSCHRPVSPFSLEGKSLGKSLKNGLKALSFKNSPKGTHAPPADIFSLKSPLGGAAGKFPTGLDLSATAAAPAGPESKDDVAGVTEVKEPGNAAEEGKRSIGAQGDGEAGGKEASATDGRQAEASEGEDRGADLAAAAAAAAAVRSTPAADVSAPALTASDLGTKRTEGAVEMRDGKESSDAVVPPASAAAVAVAAGGAETANVAAGAGENERAEGPADVAMPDAPAAASAVAKVEVAATAAPALTASDMGAKKKDNLKTDMTMGDVLDAPPGVPAFTASDLGGRRKEGERKQAGGVSGEGTTSESSIPPPAFTASDLGGSRKAGKRLEEHVLNLPEVADKAEEAAVKVPAATDAEPAAAAGDADVVVVAEGEGEGEGKEAGVQDSKEEGSIVTSMQGLSVSDGGAREGEARTKEDATTAAAVSETGDEVKFERQKNL